MYSTSVRAISPRDQPAYRPKLTTLPDGRPGGSPAAPNPSAVRIDGSYPEPVDDLPEVQSRETSSGGGGLGGSYGGGGVDPFGDDDPGCRTGPEAPDGPGRPAELTPSRERS